jgi:cytochrome c oxidase cbb3-type subunit 1
MQRNTQDDLQADVATHALGWLLIGNLVGLLMAALLLWPELGRLLTPLTYGRWTTVHLNVQLYGWCSVPLLGLLFRWYLPQPCGRGGSLALQAWSGALLFSVVAWLAGEVSGKPFMEWRGLTRWVMPGAMLVLAGVLATGYRQRLRMGAERQGQFLLKVGALVVMTAIPFVLAWASDHNLYPVFNPDSGGATGGSLLGSSLGLVLLFLTAPLILGLPILRRSPMLKAAWVLLALHYGWFFALDHGPRSHHEINQLVALFSLVVWWPILIHYMRHFFWPAGSRRWLNAFAIWGLILLATALFTFLPGVLDRWKFTNALVAHTHIAMAGLLSSFLVLVLIALDNTGRRRAALADTTRFILWHGGTYALTGILLWLGTVEADQPAALYFSGPASQTAYGVRLAAGVVMTLPVLGWFLNAATSPSAGEQP